MLQKKNLDITYLDVRTDLEEKGQLFIIRADKPRRMDNIEDSRQFIDIEADVTDAETTMKEKDFDLTFTTIVRMIMTLFCILIIVASILDFSVTSVFVIPFVTYVFCRYVKYTLKQ